MRAPFRARGRPGEGACFSTAAMSRGGWNSAASVWLHGYGLTEYDGRSRSNRSTARKSRSRWRRPGVRHQAGNPSPRQLVAVNLLEELDEPGEFISIVLATGSTSGRPSRLQGAVPSRCSMRAAANDRGQRRPVSGMIFQDGLAGGIEILGGRGNSIRKCTVRNVREMGIRVTGGSNPPSIAATSPRLEPAESRWKAAIARPSHDPSQATSNHIWNFSALAHWCVRGVFDGVGDPARPTTSSMPRTRPC